MSAPPPNPAALREKAGRLRVSNGALERRLAARGIKSPTGRPYGRTRIWKVITGQESSTGLLAAIAEELTTIEAEQEAVPA